MKLILVALLAASLYSPALSGAFGSDRGGNGFDDTREPAGPKPQLPWRAVPRSQYGYFQCTARDVGWEEHRGQHAGYGPSLWQAQRSAVANCQRFHGRCELAGCLRIQ